MFRYLLVDHAVPAMWRSLAAARLRGRLAIWERADDAGAPLDLAKDAFKRVVRAYTPPMLLWKSGNGERLLDRRFGEVGGYCQRDARHFSITRTAFSRAAAISSLAWIALSIAAISAPWLKGRD